jgi:hypothetical protein
MNALRKFLKKRSDEPLETGAAVGGATLGGVGLLDALKGYSRESDYDKLPGLDWKKFQAEIQPGDVVFTRNPGNKTEKQIMEAFAGTTYPHAELVTTPHGGKNRVMQAPGDYESADMYWLQPEKNRFGLRPRMRALAFRPDVTDPEKFSGIHRAAQLTGREYDTYPELLKRQIKTFLGSKEACGAIPGGHAICSDIPHAAYPQVLPYREDSIAEMMTRLGKPIARLDTGGKIGALDKFLAYAGHGVLKGLKPALIAGGTTAGALALAHYLKGNDNG